MSVIGLDLGTSQSAGCYLAGRSGNRDTYVEVENDMVRSGAVTRAANEKYFPSYLQYDAMGNCLVAGLRAKLLADGFPRNTVYDSKRIIGRRFDDPEVQKLKKIQDGRGHFEICDEYQQARIAIDDAVISPEQAASEIIAEMLRDALRQERGLYIRKIVISVPAYFKDVQRLKTKEAALLAIGKLQGSEFEGRICIDVAGRKAEDIQDISLIAEPSAAFVTYMARGGYRYVHKDKRALVFDLGAGTLDITIGTAMLVKDPVTREEKFTLDIRMTHGNTALGGRDMDQLVIEYIVAELGRRNVPVDGRLMCRIRDKAEQAKIDLSARESTDIIFLEQGVTIPLTRSRLVEIIRPLLDLCREELRESMGKAGLRKGEAAAIILVGGPTYMPCVRSLVEEETGTRLARLDGWDPMLCVAEGAARSCSIVVNEVIPFNYYVAVEMFKGVNVVTPVAAVGDPANIDRKIRLEVPLYTEDRVNKVTLRMVEAESRDGRVIRAGCFQEIGLPLASMPGTMTRYVSISPLWSTRELMQFRELKLRYGTILMTCRMNKDGLILQPTFYNPSTGNRVTYPDLPVWNLGEIEVIDRQAFENNLDEYAQDGYVRRLEANFNANIDMIMRTSNCNRSAAIGLLTADSQEPADKSRPSLKEAEMRAMARSRDEKAREIRNRGR